MDLDGITCCDVILTGLEMDRKGVVVVLFYFLAYCFKEFIEWCVGMCIRDVGILSYRYSNTQKFQSR